MDPDSEGYAGYAVDTDWNGRKVRAWVPCPLQERPMDLSSSAVRAGERACAALRLVDARLPGRWEPLARLLLRNEGVASSGIEGLREPTESVLVAERTGQGGTAGWVADNLVVLDEALGTSNEPLTIGTLHGWHRRLMRHGRLPAHMIGAFRPALGWVGGTSPLDAAYVPPPPSEIPRLMDDLIAFVNSDLEGLDPVSHAALIHAQFEAIHPYGDGNGRLGRVMISRTLRWRAITKRTIAPISTAIARDPGGYLSGLHLFEQGMLDPWVMWFAEIVQNAASTTHQIIDQTTALLGRWQQAVAGLRADHSARALLAHLPAFPLLCAADAAELLDVTERTARTTLAALVEFGVLSPIEVSMPAPGRNRHWFAAPDLLHLWTA